MADLKFPNIAQNNNNSFVADRPSASGGGLGDY